MTGRGPTPSYWGLILTKGGGRIAHYPGSEGAGYWFGYTARGAPIRGDEPFEIAFAAVGNSLRLYLNQQLLHEAYDTFHAVSGQIGLHCGEGDGTITYSQVEYQVLDGAKLPEAIALAGRAISPEREAVEWWQRYGGRSTVRVKDREMDVAPKAPLPTDEFTVVSMTAPSQPFKNLLLKLSRLSAITRLQFRNTALEDKHVGPLAAVKSLRALDLTGTNVTAAGVAKLRSALPDCKITVNAEVQTALDAMPKQSPTTTIEGPARKM